MFVHTYLLTKTPTLTNSLTHSLPTIVIINRLQRRIVSIHQHLQLLLERLHDRLRMPHPALVVLNRSRVRRHHPISHLGQLICPVLKERVEVAQECLLVAGFFELGWEDRRGVE